MQLNLGAYLPAFLLFASFYRQAMAFLSSSCFASQVQWSEGAGNKENGRFENGIPEIGVQSGEDPKVFLAFCWYCAC